ncbi:MAG: hypothetical protein AAFO06_12075, partial [Cyanobacteria bacterium J06597_16]
QSTCDDVPSDLPPVIRDYITQHNLYPCLQTPLARPQEKHQEKYQENYREHSHPQVHPEATLKAHR